MTIKFPTKRLATIVLLFVMTGLCGWLSYPYDVWLAALLLFCLLILGLLFLTQTAWLARPQQNWTMGKLIPVMAIIFGLSVGYFLALTMFRSLDKRSVEEDFVGDKNRYDEVVRSALKKSWDQGLHRAEVAGSHVEVDVSDAIRIQMHTQGFFSNWESVIYDPSDLYAGDSHHHHFNGTVYGCRNLSGHYYHCRYDMEKF